MKNKKIGLILFILATAIGCGFAQDKAIDEASTTQVSERLPFSVGDVLSFTSLVPIKSSATVAQNAKVIQILGRWVFVRCKVGGADDSFWINSDNILLFKIEQKAKN